MTHQFSILEFSFTEKRVLVFHFFCATFSAATAFGAVLAARAAFGAAWAARADFSSCFCFDSCLATAALAYLASCAALTYSTALVLTASS